MGTELTVFSPSATETFSKCPRKWALNRAGWKRRIIQYPELCAVLGDGFSESMRLLNKGLSTGVSVPSEQIIHAGMSVIVARLNREIEAGRRVDEADVAFSEKLDTYLTQAVLLYLKVNPLKDWKVLAAEQTYPEHGNARIDLLAADALGPAVFDYKLKVKLDSKWEAAELDKHSRSQQRFHYQWCAGTNRFFIVLVVLGPKPYVKLCPYGESPYFDSGLWNLDSVATWQAMQNTKEIFNTPGLLPPGSLVHQDQYGPCEYEEACLRLALDPELMRISYVQLPKEVK